MCWLKHMRIVLSKKLKDKKKQKKAKIKAHSDKTKDLPENAIIAFCSFSKSYSFCQFNDPNLNIKKSKDDFFDCCYSRAKSNKTTVLTKLKFRLKDTVQDQSLVKKFSLTLYPNSVFLIPLSTNRFYTHEIQPSILPIDLIPTRMGYVIRCSNTMAVFKNDQTYILNNGEDI
jgi:hypothetical protein